MLLRALHLPLAVALASVAVAQAPMTGVEQARMDSIRRPYTKPDIEFMSGMIHHHAQAVKMARWCPDHGANQSLVLDWTAPCHCTVNPPWPTLGCPRHNPLPKAAP